MAEINCEKIKRKEKAKSLVGKAVCLKNDKDKVLQVVGYDNRGYVFLDDRSMQDVMLLVVVEND